MVNSIKTINYSSQNVVFPPEPLGKTCLINVTLGRLDRGEIGKENGIKGVGRTVTAVNLREQAPQPL